ncbi:hypothetical protein D9M69_664620 [compost metagenome]
MRAALHHGFFRLQDFLEVIVFALQLEDLFLDQAQAAQRCFVFFLLDGFALDFQLDQTAFQLVHHFRLRVDLDLDLRRRFIDQVDRLVR